MSDIDKEQEKTGKPEPGKSKSPRSVKDNRKRKARRRRITALILLVLLIGGGFYFFNARRQAAETAAQAAARSSSTYTVTSRTFREEVEISGNVEPVHSEDLFFRTTGEVREVLVETGDRVSPGDVVAVLRMRTKEYELASLDYEIEQARFDSSIKRLELLEMQRELLLEDIDNSYLKAGISGVISRVNIDPGDLVSASASVPSVRIIDDSALKSVVEVDEFDINKVSRGQPVELIFDALGSRNMVRGTVHTVPLEGVVTSQGIAVKEVEIRIENPPANVSPSYTFSGVIVASDEQQILAFPQNFLISSEGTQRVLVQRDDGEVEQVTVRTAYFESGLVRLISGDIEAGDQLILQGLDRTGGNSSFRFGPPGVRR